MKRYIPLLALLLASQLYPQDIHIENYSYLGKVPEKININRKNILDCLINSSGNVWLGNIFYPSSEISFIRNAIYDKFAKNDKLIICVKIHDNTKYGDYKAVIDELKMADAKRIPDDVVPGRKFIPYDTPPKPLTPIIPNYPEVAQEAGIEGVVIVQIFVDEKGRVKETMILKGIPNTGLDEAAIAAIRKTRFEPAKQRKRPVGVWISIPVNFRWYENGQKNREGTIKDGKQDGLEIGWHENGQKRYESSYRDGKQDGLEIGWYESGQKSFEGTYKNGKEDGLEIFWYESGQKSKERTYKDGNMDGLWTYWYSNGQKKYEGIYMDGELISEECWDKDGNECECEHLGDVYVFCRQW